MAPEASSVSNYMMNYSCASNGGNISGGGDINSSSSNTADCNNSTSNNNSNLSNSGVHLRMLQSSLGSSARLRQDLDTQEPGLHLLVVSLDIVIV